MDNGSEGADSARRYECRTNCLSAVANVDVAVKKPGPPATNKKRRVAPTTASPTDDRTPPAGPILSTASSTTRITSPNPTVPMKEANAGGHSLTDKLAEQLFGDVRDSRPKPDSAAGLPARDLLLLPSDAPIAPAAATHAHAPVPRPQTDDQRRVSHTPAPRHEGYYPPHHSTPFAEPFTGYYGPSEHSPPSWMGPGVGWYPPGPGSGIHPSASGAPMGGPGHHPGYWPHGPPFPNPYGHYLQPGAPPSHRPQDNVPREHGGTT